MMQKKVRPGWDHIELLANGTQSRNLTISIGYASGCTGAIRFEVNWKK
jgi:hypothetical protein